MGRYEGTLLDIARAARAVLTFTQGLQKGQFLPTTRSSRLLPRWLRRLWSQRLSSVPLCRRQTSVLKGGVYVESCRDTSRGVSVSCV
jgi:hypothetical protein